MFYRRSNKELSSVVIAVSKSMQPHLKYVQIHTKPRTADGYNESTWISHPVIDKTTLPDPSHNGSHDAKKNTMHKIMHTLHKLQSPTVSVIDPGVRISLDPNTIPRENPPPTSSCDTIFV